MNYSPEELRDRLARRIHAFLLFALILGIAVWLFRVYGFEPLQFNAAPGGISP